MDFPIKNGDFPFLFVSSPEGIHIIFISANHGQIFPELPMLGRLEIGRHNRRGEVSPDRLHGKLPRMEKKT